MPTSLKKFVKAGGGRLAAMTGRYAYDFRQRMVVVAFHRINNDLPSDGLTCSGEKFEAFCLFFKRYFNVVAFSEQVAGCRSGRDMGGTLSITFDDGYLDNYEVAAPILRKLNLPATFFVATGFVESQVIPFWDQSLPRQPGWMSWDQVRDLRDQGFEFGCHTDTHVDLGSAGMDIVRAELAISRRKLGEQLGLSTDLFAYPFGGREHINEQSMGVVRDMGFVCCASCYGGSNPPVADPFDIRRIGIAGWFETPHQFGFELLTNRA